MSKAKEVHKRIKDWHIDYYKRLCTEFPLYARFWSTYILRNKYNLSYYWRNVTCKRCKALRNKK